MGSIVGDEVCPVKVGEFEGDFVGSVVGILVCPGIVGEFEGDPVVIVNDGFADGAFVGDKV